MNTPDLSRSPGLRIDDQGPVFRAPWEAQAFGLALALYERGVFTWPEWTRALSEEIATAQEREGPDDGSRYFEHWLAALESLVAQKRVTSADELIACKQAWDRAARSTPHGKPILLPDTDVTVPPPSPR